MRRAERLFRLVNEMRTRSVFRAGDLARHLEVSVRTVYRDIAQLQASGLPIEGEAGIGYVLRPGFDLPRMTFTHEQVEALAVGLSFVESLDDPDLASAAREARAAIQAGLPRPEARALADAPYFSLRRRTGTPGLVRMVRQAIRERRIMELAYLDRGGQDSERRVRPLALWNLPEGWMFSGWCELRQGFRTFRLDRIRHACLTSETYAAEEAKGLRALLEQDRCTAQA